MKIVSLMFAMSPFVFVGCASSGGAVMSRRVQPASWGQNSGSVSCLEGQILEGGRCISVERRK